MQCLTEKTDAEHSVTTQEIIDYLALQGINAERKSIYTDIDLLIDYGMDIVKNSGRSGGYTLVSRQFELAELKLLVDAVQSSKFITTKKSRDLIGKLETLCSKYEAGQLHRQVVVTNRNKTVNENIYYNVDIIYNAIAENVKIQFQYFEWDVNKEMHLRRNCDGGKKNLRVYHKKRAVHSPSVFHDARNLWYGRCGHQYACNRRKRWCGGSCADRTR